MQQPEIPQVSAVMPQASVTMQQPEIPQVFAAMPQASATVQQPVAPQVYVPESQPAVPQVYMAQQPLLRPESPQPTSVINFTQETDMQGRNYNDRILELFESGKSKVAIAKELNLGVGEVKLVIDLYKNRSEK